MVKIIFLVGLLVTLISFSVNSSEFNQPWNDPNTAIIIDPYKHNAINWNELKKDKRVVAIIHKATEGMVKDGKYHERKKEALKRGYLWGSYHLGRPGDPIKQAENYLKVTDPEISEFIALDLEAISSNFMSLESAKKFVEHIASKTQRYPALYVNHSTAKKITNLVKKDDVLSKCSLWYARFRKDIPNFPRGLWNTYTLWQFSSEINCSEQGKCLYNVPGTKYDMDINIYNGTISDLKASWPLTQAFGAPASTHLDENE